jgi:hypothetical protein
LHEGLVVGGEDPAAAAVGDEGLADHP